MLTLLYSFVVKIKFWHIFLQGEMTVILKLATVMQLKQYHFLGVEKSISLYMEDLMQAGML